MSYRWSLLVAPVLALVAFAAWSTPGTVQAQNTLNCPDFRSQADAQANLRANPSDPNRLDDDNDGVACENNPAPFDRNPVNRSGATAPATQPAPAAAPRPASPATGQASALPSTGTGLVADTTLPASWTLGGMALLMVLAGGVAAARRPR